MTWQRFKYYAKAWCRNLLSFRLIPLVLAPFGALWLFVEMSTFFFGNTRLPNIIKENWLLFGIAGFSWAALKGRPKLSSSCKLEGRDIAIEIAIGDVFSFPGAIIVGTNSTFDTRISRELISEKSIQGLFTKKYYASELQLDAELSRGLANIEYEVLSGSRVGKRNRYPIGTVVRLNLKQCTTYFLAIAHLNEHGVAVADFEKLKESLAKLWFFIGQQGLKESLIMPILGTGFCRLPQPREEVVREIIKSFLAACSETTFCDKLTIAIAPSDVEKHNIMLSELGLFLTYVCKYSSPLAIDKSALPIGSSAGRTSEA